MTARPWTLGWISTAEPSAPVRLRLSRQKGFDLQALSLATNGLPAVRVTRPGKWGNPHVPLRSWFHGGFSLLGLEPFDAVTAADADAEGVRIAVALFRHDWDLAMKAPNYSNARASLEELRGRNLACWCKPGAPCHADVLLELANRPVCEEVTPGEARKPAKWAEDGASSASADAPSGGPPPAGGETAVRT